MESIALDRALKRGSSAAADVFAVPDLSLAPVAQARSPHHKRSLGGLWSILVHLGIVAIAMLGLLSTPRMEFPGPRNVLTIDLDGLVQNTPVVEKPTRQQPSPAPAAAPPQPVETQKPVVKSTPTKVSPKPTPKKTVHLTETPEPAERSNAEAQTHAEPQPQPPVAADAKTPMEARVEPQETPSTSPTAAADAAPAGGRGKDELPWAYLWKVKRLISSNRRYPRKAYGAGQEGTAVVRIHLSRDGRLLGATLLRGTGYTALDEEAQAVVLRIGEFPPLPDRYLPGRGDFAIDQPIGFKLRY